MRGLARNLARGAIIRFIRARQTAMSVTISASQALRFLDGLSRSLVTEAKIEAAPDFTLRQLAVFLTVYIDRPPHTVRGLSGALGVAKPVISRALDALGRYDLVARKRDEKDGRNVIVQRTVRGALYIETLGDLVIARAAALPPMGHLE